ncbi:Small ribosomal subunit biogenesis GTPase RsgA [Austwickia sp. TVS 96-490-7B]|nr:Small ribosomal subunit biogenesis GTPase RsgA [Austwickia sp. TVS 96-490-7B]
MWFPHHEAVEARVELRRQLQVTPVAGDWITMRDGQINGVMERRTVLTRPQAGGRGTQVLAANIDLVFIVLPIDRSLNLKLLERLSVMAWDSGAAPMLILTKSDAATDTAEALDQAQMAAPGVETLLTSSVDGRGISDLRARLGRGVTATMLGASGAGKTSLLNALDDRTEFTREVRRSGDGRHSTTTRRLYQLTSGGVLLDLPGIRSLDLSASAQAVDEIFAEITTIARKCRFSDCQHNGEPGCAIQAAIDLGKIDERRIDSWRAIRREQAYQERRHDPRKMAAQRSEWKKATRATRSVPRRYSHD